MNSMKPRADELESEHFNIRSAVSQDAFDLTQLTQDDADALQYGCPRLASAEWWGQRIRQTQDCGRVFVAHKGRGVLGMVTLDVPLTNWFRRHVGIIGLCVHPSFRRRGVGRQLLSFALSEAEDLGLARVELNVWTDNTSAIALYESVGFIREGLHPDYGMKSGRHCSAITMGIRLGSSMPPLVSISSSTSHLRG